MHSPRPKRKAGLPSDHSSKRPKKYRKNEDAPYRAGRASPTLKAPLEPVYRTSRAGSATPDNQENDDGVREGVEGQWVFGENYFVGDDLLTAEAIVRDSMKTYKAYFRNPDDLNDTSFDPHPTNYPVAELEYPNYGSSERFILLAPKDKDHYSPILCLAQTLYTIIECYLTPAQQSLFGSLSLDNLPIDDEDDNDANDNDGNASNPPSPPSPSLSPSPTHSSASYSSFDSELTDISSNSSVDVPLSAGLHLESHQPPILKPKPHWDPNRPNHLRTLRRAIHLQNGPLFLTTLARINSLLRTLKYPPLSLDPWGPDPPNALTETVRTWRTLPKKVLHRIIEETYQRAIGPHVERLRQYEAFSSTVYGELLPSLVTEIVALCKLAPGSRFVDLGSGVGNVVLHAALQAGCRAYGIELMPSPGELAEGQESEFRKRCAMWGVRCGAVELERGDFLKSGRVDEVLREADVVLVNNKVFSESLNNALRPKFLDLKENALVISLQPFVPITTSSSATRLTSRNIDDISAIFDVVSKGFPKGSVSWTGGAGVYYVHRVDRTGYAEVRRRFEESTTDAIVGGRGSGRRSRNAG